MNQVHDEISSLNPLGFEWDSAKDFEVLKQGFCDDNLFFKPLNGVVDRLEIAARICRLITISFGEPNYAVFLLGSLVNKVHKETSDFDFLVFVTENIKQDDTIQLLKRISLFLNSVGFSTNDLALDIAYFNLDESINNLPSELGKRKFKDKEHERLTLIAHQMQLFNVRYRSRYLGGSIKIAKKIFELCPEYFWNSSLRNFLRIFSNILFLLELSQPSYLNYF
jgi:hypothetical protein